MLMVYDEILMRMNHETFFDLDLCIGHGGKRHELPVRVSAAAISSRAHITKWRTHSNSCIPAITIYCPGSGT